MSTIVPPPPDNPGDPRPSARDLLGIAPGWTGAACTDDYLAWSRDAERDEMKHPACADYLFEVSD